MRPALRVVGLAARFTRPLSVLLLLGQFAWENRAAGRDRARQGEPGAPGEGFEPSLPAEARGAAATALGQGERSGSQPAPAAQEETGAGGDRALPNLAFPRATPAPDLSARSGEVAAPTAAGAGGRRAAGQAGEAEPQAALRELPLPDGLSAGVLDASPIRRLVIPALELDVEVVEAPFVERTWDISELGGKVAWLTGTAWPSQMGNTALAGHITARRIGEGPFRYLHRLKEGDPVYVYTGEYLYTYRVREQVVVKIEDVHVLAPTGSPQLTLLTCTNWDEKLSTYLSRRVVFADLVRTAPVLAGR